MLYRNSHSIGGLNTALFVLLAIAGAYFVGRMICSEPSQVFLIILAVLCLFFVISTGGRNLNKLRVIQRYLPEPALSVNTNAGYARNPKYKKTAGAKNLEEPHWIPFSTPVKKFSCFL
jgi:hypothetical protein